MTITDPIMYNEKVVTWKMKVSMAIAKAPDPTRHACERYSFLYKLKTNFIIKGEIETLSAIIHCINSEHF